MRKYSRLLSLKEVSEKIGITYGTLSTYFGRPELASYLHYERCRKVFEEDLPEIKKHLYKLMNRKRK